MTHVQNQIEIAPGANPADSPSTFVWTSAGSRRQSAPIQVSAGRDDEASSVEPGSMGLTMDDRAGDLSPRNVLGQWYGALRKNTPIRVALPRAADTFTRTVTAGAWGTTTDGFTWIPRSDRAIYYSVDGSRGVLTLPTNFDSYVTLDEAGSPDVEIVWSTAVPVLPTGANFVSGSMLRREDDSTFLKVQIELTPAGTVAVLARRHTAAGDTTLIAFTATGVTYSAGQKVWAKARADGPYIMVKAWTGNLSDEPAAWPGVGSDNVIEGSGAGLFHWRINSNAGTYTAYIDDVTVTNILWQGTVPEWPVRWPDKSGADCVVPLSASGVLRRIKQGKSSIQSALRTHLSSLPYTFAYYPCEDGSDAKSAASGLPGGIPASVRGITFASDDRLGGSDALPTFDTAGSSYIAANIKGRTTADGFSVMGFFALPTLPATDTNFLVISATGTGTQFIVTLGNFGPSFAVYDRDGTLIANDSATYVVDPTKPVAIQIETGVAAGVTTVALIWNQVGSDTFYAITDTYSGTSVTVTRLVAYGVVDGMTGGQFWVGDNDLPFAATSFILISSGYVGELASARIARLCGQSAVPAYILDGDSEPMGRQRSGKLVDLLQECADADLGILFERGGSLAYLPRGRRYNAPVTLALDWALGHLAEPPEPDDSDQRFRNQWTVTRTDGSSAVAADQDSITASGLYDDAATVNIQSDGRLPDYASWMLSQGIADNLRWPRLAINLVAHPEFIASWLACRIGSRVTVANVPDQLAGEVVDVIIEGYSEEIGNDQWDVVMSCSPAQDWQVAVYDDGHTRYDSASTTLKTGVNDSATALTFRTTDARDLWDTTATPYDVVISGHICTVTAMGAASLVSGAYDQVATVTRGAFAKALSADEPIHVADRERYAL